MKPQFHHPIYFPQPLQRIAGWAGMLFLLCHCGSSPPTSRHFKGPADYLETGLALRDMGDHLNASYWLEAALDQSPERETHILRLLVEEQILAGRLLAAQSGLDRLRVIAANDSSITMLAIAISNATAHQSNAMKEATP
ncbi:MAG: hypothetical protein JXR76_02290 [Deltaproteobacteria bacterium]|nr:hypothetical protein [Deltaproteobacteria bacterium]